MCGIIGILGNEASATRVLEGLKRLEYRGYDSAGIATLENGRIDRVRAEGKLKNLAEKLDKFPLAGKLAIGHTRWATHGAPTENNAHPHLSTPVAIVHNGIIENHAALRVEVEGAGRKVVSDTDTEIVAHLVAVEMDKGKGAIDAVRSILPRLQGAFALLFLFENEDDLLIAARRGSPLTIGYGEGENYVGSDGLSLAPFTTSISYLEEGDWAILRRGSVQIFDETNAPVSRPVMQNVASAAMAEKGNYRHFMMKEIHEQPEVVSHTLSHYLDLANHKVHAPDGLDFTKTDFISLSACGSAYIAGLVGRYWFEEFARLPVDMDVASEFRYREPPMPKNGMSIFVSQSGETADTLATLRFCKGEGQFITSVVNVPGSTIARESHLALPTLAGPEISVASTKGFTCQLAVMASLSLIAAHQRGKIAPEREAELVAALASVPRLMLKALEMESEIEGLGRELSKFQNVLYIGRGRSYPLALEGALKLKELSYIHAEGYPAGELKHGPIALLDENMPVVVIAPHDALFEKTASNMQEVVARGSEVILITDEKGAKAANVKTMKTIVMPDAHPFITPLVYAIPLQLMAYHTALFKGTDVDQPRNLAKSVTVE